MSPIHFGDCRFKTADFWMGTSYFIRNRIFLTKELQDQFKKIDDLMWETLISREVGEESKDRKMIHESYKNLKGNVDPIVHEIENLVQKRLQYQEA